MTALRERARSIRACTPESAFSTSLPDMESPLSLRCISSSLNSSAAFSSEALIQSLTSSSSWSEQHPVRNLIITFSSGLFIMIYSS